MTYQVKVNNGSWETVNNNDVLTVGNTARYMKLGLSKNTTYSFYLRAKNSDGITSESVKVVGKTNSPEITLFGARGADYDFYTNLTKLKFDTLKQKIGVSNVNLQKNSSAEDAVESLKNNSKFCMIKAHGSYDAVIINGETNSRLSKTSIDNIPKNGLSHIDVLVLSACQTGQDINTTTLMEAFNNKGVKTTIGFVKSIKVVAASKFETAFEAQIEQGLKEGCTYNSEFIRDCAYNARSEALVDDEEGMKSMVIY